MWLPTADQQRRFTLLSNAVCECVADLAANAPDCAHHLVASIKDFLFTGRDKELARTGKAAKVNQAAPSVLRCCAMAAIMSASLRRAQLPVVR